MSLDPVSASWIQIESPLTNPYLEIPIPGLVGACSGRLSWYTCRSPFDDPDRTSESVWSLGQFRKLEYGVFYSALDFRLASNNHHYRQSRATSAPRTAIELYPAVCQRGTNLFRIYRKPTYR